MQTYRFDKAYDCIVIGAGHAGCEAALAASRMGVSTLLLTMNLDTIAQMSCNPAIGGLGKGHLVREMDSLGGEMAKVTDQTGIHFKMLNTSRGPAVWAPRAQCDKKAYQFRYKHVVELQKNLDVKQQQALEILAEQGAGGRKQIRGVLTTTGIEFLCKIVIVTTGTFLKGLIHVGEAKIQSGRFGEQAAVGLTASLEKLGIQIGRLKTGTPPRVNRRTIQYEGLEIHPPDNPPQPFSYSTEKLTQPQINCHGTYTSEETHQLIRANTHRAPMYNGQIQGVGPRYCPSIEDKVNRFRDKTRHQLFLEPEGYNTEEVYINGLSTSLPQDIQIAILKTIKGLEHSEIMRFGYAVEYDFAPPTQLWPSLETKLIDGLFHAGQINGTSGYEEAGAQGLIAGINAALKLRGNPPLILGRSEAYIGVMIDDLVTKGVDEPYRLFTSRAEHRLLLRQDNADQRLMKYGVDIGLVPPAFYEQRRKKWEKVKERIYFLSTTHTDEGPLAQLLRRPEVRYDDLIKQAPKVQGTVPRGDSPLFEPDEDVKLQVETEIKYEGYIRREEALVERFKKLEEKKFPAEFSFDIKGLRREAQEKLNRVRPLSIGQASRISGITPCDISLLLVRLEQRKL
ncbi:MAG: tRNA uridine-5-carboxymethylaminomethyl(34) synthesis enzyme MnmG [Candidatus Omnitrophica bacterium]|nr:tRNA uridine-5-carboxymethylaminomethyl(34) synthesis enzyme MnmG [Candidatus Omnitrophota bacterium]